jgi:hypothetical protein
MPSKRSKPQRFTLAEAEALVDHKLISKGIHLVPYDSMGTVVGFAIIKSAPKYARLVVKFRYVKQLGFGCTEHSHQLTPLMYKKCSDISAVPP